MYADGGPVVELLFESELEHETDHLPVPAQPGAGLDQHDVGGQNLLHADDVQVKVFKNHQTIVTKWVE